MTTATLTTNEIIDTLNDLIETSKDGEKGFLKAAEETHSTHLRSIFREGAQRCTAGVRELHAQVIAYGGDPETSGSLAGAIHRGWLNLKTAVSSRDDLAILEECERGEDYAKRRYAEALTKDLPESVRMLIQRQYEGVIANHDLVRSLRDERK